MSDRINFSKPNEDCETVNHWKAAGDIAGLLWRANVVEPVVQLCTRQDVYNVNLNRTFLRPDDLTDMAYGDVAHSEA